jgi:lipopolysaccharide export system permease protein
MVVMSACGLGPGRIYKPLLALGVLVAVVLAWMTLFVSPEVQGMINRLKVSAQQQADLAILGAGRFNELHSGQLTFYAERLSDDKSQMENLFIVLRNRDEAGTAPQMLTARSAWRTTDEASGDDVLVLVDGYRYEGKPGTADYRVMAFSKYGVRVGLPGASIVQELRESVPTMQLLQSGDLLDIAELQWRLALPVSAIVLLLLAVPLSKSSPRQGRYGRLALAVLLFIIYYNLLGIARVWVGRGVVPPVIGLWWVTLLPVLLTAALLRGDRMAGRTGLLQ